MEEQEQSAPSDQKSDSAMLYYGIGAAVIVLLVAGFYLFKSKSAPQSPSTSTPVQTAAPNVPLVRPSGPIKGLACELQYYNPVIGFDKYYLSALGADLTTSNSVTCDFVVKVNQNEVSRESVSNVSMTEESSRSGKIFTCTTSQLELQPNIPTEVSVDMKNDQGKSATCSSMFILPPKS